MPPNSIVKDSLVVGGLTLLGYMAGGKLGSMFGKSQFLHFLCSYKNIQILYKYFGLLRLPSFFFVYTYVMCYCNHQFPLWAYCYKINLNKY